MPSSPALRLITLARDPLSFEALATPQSLKEYPAAFDQLLKDAKATFVKILRQRPADATFASVVEAVLDISPEMDVLWNALGNLHHTNGSEVTRKLVQSLQPKLTVFQNHVSLSSELYALLRRVKGSRAALTPFQKRSLHLLMRGMEVAGVHLPEAKKKKLRIINKQMAALGEKFNDNATLSRKEFFHHFADDSSLQEVTAQEMASAKAEAKARKLAGWVFTLSPPSYISIMRYCSDAEVRKKFFMAQGAVATSGKHDNRPLALRMLKLRHERAVLLGYKTFADYVIDDRMAKKVSVVDRMLGTYARYARPAAKKDLAMLKQISGLQTVQWWDMSYWGQKLRKEKFNVNEKELKQYFPLEAVMDGMFAIAKTLFQIEFKQKKTTAKDLRLYEVSRSGRHAGYLYIDLFARPQKRGGAWCSLLRDPVINGETREEPVTLIEANFGKAEGKEPTLLKHGEVTTLFHEFGHALHTLLSQAPYRNLNAFLTEWDFVELPSQLMENWCWDPEALALFAKHYQTGKPLPRHLIDGLQQSRHFLQGLDSLGRCEFSFLDLLLHTKRPPASVRALDAFCLGVSKKYSLLPTNKEHKRYASFSHIFGGGYAAGYYSYLWAEILEADVFGVFEKKGVLHAATGESLRREILSTGATRPGLDSFRAFMGRGPDAKALLRKQGLL